VGVANDNSMEKTQLKIGGTETNFGENTWKMTWLKYGVDNGFGGERFSFIEKYADMNNTLVRIQRRRKRILF
jgi:hypothetical protein